MKETSTLLLCCIAIGCYTTAAAAPTLSSLSVKGVQLSPAFSPEVTNYSATVNASTNSVVVTPKCTNATCSLDIGNNFDDVSGQRESLSLNDGGGDGANTTIAIVVHNEAKTTNMTYYLNIVRPAPGKNTVLGYGACLVATLFFGSNFIPVKKYDSGDGFFFSLVMCLGVWCAGLVVQMIRGSEFYNISMLGGAIWSVGNLLCVTIIKRIGMGMGLLIWGCSALVVGWFTGYFGLGNIIASERDQIKKPVFNILALVFAVTTLALSLMVKPTTDSEQKSKNSSSGELLQPLNSNPMGGMDEEEEMDPTYKRLSGTLMAVVAGFFFGSNFDPPTYAQEHYADASQNALDYVFAHFCGILLTNCLAFCGYCVYKGNKPVINVELCFPAFCSGLLWAVAQIAWFIANVNLGFTSAYPIITTGPGLVGILWGIFYFGEIKGATNYMWVASLFFFLGLSVICVVQAKG